MKPEDVDSKLMNLGRNAMIHLRISGPGIPTFEEKVRAVLAAVLPEHDAQLRAERDALKAASRRVRNELTAALAIWEPEHEHHRDRAERKGYAHDEAAATVYDAAIKVVTRAIAALAAPEAPGGEL